MFKIPDSSLAPSPPRREATSNYKEKWPAEPSLHMKMPFHSLKRQDHYKALGLDDLRYKATPEQLEDAYKEKLTQRVSLPHLALAWETLSFPVTRRHYDSIDPKANVHPPGPRAKGDFFKMWAPVFESEARFAIVAPEEVPPLGSMLSKRSEVDAFYKFWYEFKSWRSFEYYDVETDDPETEDRNRYFRELRKAVDVARLRRLVDACLRRDPRIPMLDSLEENAKLLRDKEEREKEAMELERAEKERQAVAEAAAAVLEDEQRRKKEKKARKDAKKKSKRSIRTRVMSANYFGGQGESVGPQQIDGVLGDMDTMVENLEEDELEMVVREVDGAKDALAVRRVLEKAATLLVRSKKLAKGSFKFFTV